MSSRLAEFCLRSLKACAAPRANEDRLVEPDSRGRRIQEYSLKAPLKDCKDFRGG